MLPNVCVHHFVTDPDCVYFVCRCTWMVQSTTEEGPRFTEKKIRRRLVKFKRVLILERHSVEISTRE